MASNPSQTERHETHEAPQAAPRPAEKARDVQGVVQADLFKAEMGGQLEGVLEGMEASESAEGGTDDEGKGFGEGDNGKVSDSAGSGQSAATQPIPPPPPAPPEPQVMKREVAKAIRTEIRQEEKRVLRHYIGWQRLDPSSLEKVIAKIRNLKTMLADALEAVGEALTSLYRKWVLREGM